jgi:hypothetical protein
VLSSLHASGYDSEEVICDAASLGFFPVLSLGSRFLRPRITT